MPLTSCIAVHAVELCSLCTEAFNIMLPDAAAMSTCTCCAGLRADGQPQSSVPRALLCAAASAVAFPLAAIVIAVIAPLAIVPGSPQSNASARAAKCQIFHRQPCPMPIHTSMAKSITVEMHTAVQPAP